MSSTTPSAATSSANAPTLRQAADAVLTDEEKTKLKQNLIAAQIEQTKYLRAHPEISKAIQFAMAALLKEQPADAIAFLTGFLGGSDLLDRVVLAQATDEDLQWQVAQRGTAPEAE